MTNAKTHEHTLDNSADTPGIVISICCVWVIMTKKISTVKFQESVGLSPLT